MVPRTYIFDFCHFFEAQIDINNLFQDDSIFSCIRLNNLVIIRRATGPDVDQIVEVPEIISKVLEKVRGPQLAILE